MKLTNKQLKRIIKEEIEKEFSKAQLVEATPEEISAQMKTALKTARDDATGPGSPPLAGAQQHKESEEMKQKMAKWAFVTDRRIKRLEAQQKSIYDELKTAGVTLMPRRAGPIDARDLD